MIPLLVALTKKKGKAYPAAIKKLHFKRVQLTVKNIS
jgi:hypothetical protein